MKNVNSKNRNIAVASIAVTVLLALLLLGALIGGYAASAATANSTLAVTDKQAETLAKDAIAFGNELYYVKKIDKKVRWENEGFRPDHAYYVYEVELRADYSKVLGGIAYDFVDDNSEVDVYVDGRNGEIIRIDY